MKAVHYVSIGLMLAASTFPALAPVAQSPTPTARSFDHCTGFIDSLPMTIVTPGTWCLRRDLSTAIDRGNAIAVNSDNVTIDCNNFKIDGLEAGPDSFARGIHSEDHQNITIRQCRIRGFRFGVNLSAEFLGVRGGHLVEDNRLDVNISVGLQVIGDDSVVQRNTVRDTGGTALPTQAMIMAGSIDIIDNTVNGVIGTGIAAFFNMGGTISGNRVWDVAGSDNSSQSGGVGILLSETGESLEVTGNHLNANPGRFPGAFITTGIWCRVEEETSAVFSNIIVGFDRPVVGCNDFDNKIAPRRELRGP